VFREAPRAGYVGGISGACGSLITSAFEHAGFLGIIEHAADGNAALLWVEERIARNKPQELPSQKALTLLT
jgi:hypothetical protein